MRFNRGLLAVVFCMLCAVTGPASAQQGCDALWGAAEICELPTSPPPLDYNWNNPEQGDISFRLVSRECTAWLWIICLRWQGIPYTLEVTGPAANGAFLLSGAGGSLPIRLTYSSTNVTGLPLPPGASSAAIQGHNRHESVYITVWLAEPLAAAHLLAGTYSGTFNLTLSQRGSCNPDCLTVPFSIDLVVPANIRISGLDDMEINAPGEMAKDEDFCVFTQGGAPFGIKADSAVGSDGSFQLGGRITGDRITYHVEANTSPPSAPMMLTEGVPTAPIWSGHTQLDCGGGSNMRITVTLPPGALDNAVESTYTDTLTITVELE